MSPNILITGAAGYIGGSMLEHFLRTKGAIKQSSLYAAVRSKEHFDSLSKLPVTPVMLEVNDEKAVTEVVLQNEIDIFINTTASFVPDIVLNICKALGERRKITNQPVYFIHCGVSTVFSAEAGWPHGEIRDDDVVYEKEKSWETEHPVRTTDLLVVESAKAHGVTSMNVVVPVVYGRGTGEGRKVSTSIPAYVRTSIKDGVVHQFDPDSTPPYTHVADVTALFAILVENILQGENISSGEKGYYFAIAHRAPQWVIMKSIASSLYRRGLVSEPEPRIWPNDEIAAEKLGFPIEHVRAMGTTSGKQVAVNAFRLGWQPEWDEKRFLASIDDEVQAAIDLGSGNTSLFNPLLRKATQS